MFSHSEDSPKYSECDVKGGDISDWSKNSPGLPSSIPLYSYRSSVTSVLVENKIKPKDMSYYFSYIHAPTLNLNNIDVSNTTVFDRCFINNTSLIELDISSWNTLSDATMNEMFFNSNHPSLRNINYGNGFVQPSSFNNMFTGGSATVCNRPSWYSQDYVYILNRGSDKQTTNTINLNNKMKSFSTIVINSKEWIDDNCITMYNEKSRILSVVFYDNNNTVISQNTYTYDYGKVTEYTSIPSGTDHITITTTRTNNNQVSNHQMAVTFM